MPLPSSLGAISAETKAQKDSRWSWLSARVRASARMSAATVVLRVVTFSRSRASSSRSFMSESSSCAAAGRLSEVDAMSCWPSASSCWPCFFSAESWSASSS